MSYVIIVADDEIDRGILAELFDREPACRSFSDVVRVWKSFAGNVGGSVAPVEYVSLLLYTLYQDERIIPLHTGMETAAVPQTRDELAAMLRQVNRRVGTQIGTRLDDLLRVLRYQRRVGLILDIAWNPRPSDELNALLSAPPAVLPAALRTHLSRQGVSVDDALLWLARSPRQRPAILQTRHMSNDPAPLVHEATENLRPLAFVFRKAELYHQPETMLRRLIGGLLTACRRDAANLPPRPAVLRPLLDATHDTFEALCEKTTASMLLVEADDEQLARLTMEEFFPPANIPWITIRSEDDLRALDLFAHDEVVVWIESDSLEDSWSTRLTELFSLMAARNAGCLFARRVHVIIHRGAGIIDVTPLPRVIRRALADLDPSTLPDVEHIRLTADTDGVRRLVADLVKNRWAKSYQWALQWPAGPASVPEEKLYVDDSVAHYAAVEGLEELKQRLFEYLENPGDRVFAQSVPPALDVITKAWGQGNEEPLNDRLAGKLAGVCEEVYRQTVRPPRLGQSLTALEVIKTLVHVKSDNPWLLGDDVPAKFALRRMKPPSSPVYGTISRLIVEHYATHSNHGIPAEWWLTLTSFVKKRVIELRTFDGLFEEPPGLPRISIKHQERTYIKAVIFCGNRECPGFRERSAIDDKAPDDIHLFSGDGIDFTAVRDLLQHPARGVNHPALLIPALRPRKPTARPDLMMAALMARLNPGCAAAVADLLTALQREERDAVYELELQKALEAFNRGSIVLTSVSDFARLVVLHFLPHLVRTNGAMRYPLEMPSFERTSRDFIDGTDRRNNALKMTVQRVREVLRQ